MTLPAHKEQRFTYRDYMTWTGEERYELIQGIPVAMPPAPAPRHQETATTFGAFLRTRLKDRPCRVFAAPIDVRLPRGDEADDFIDTIVQPDITVACDPSKLDSRGLRGAPDLIIEILSPSTAQKDQTVKLRLYEDARVPEYWIVHPEDRILYRYVYSKADGRYGRPEILTDQDALQCPLLGETPFELREAFPDP